MSLLWMSPALSGGGYSSEALSFAAGLAPLMGNNFRLRQFAEQPDESFVKGLPKSLLANLSDFFEMPNAQPAAGIVVCHSPPDAWVPSKFPGWDALSPCPPPRERSHQHVIGRTMYETDSLPIEWVRRCNRMDSVWVPTEFHRETFERAGVAADKLEVVGEAVDTAFFDPSIVTPLDLPPLAAEATASTTRGAVVPFRFLAVFKWELRKGWDALLQAYFEEFAPSESVELVLKTQPFHSSSDFDRLIDDHALRAGLPAQRTQRPPVRVLDRALPLDELPRLYAAADAFVLPSRGEGWGRPHVEAMAMGLPLIATNWSGPTAFLDSEVGYPLNYELQPVAAELNLPGHRWAEPSVPHLRELMRRVFERRDEAKERGLAARERMRTLFSPEVLAADVLRIANAALAEAKRKRRKSSKAQTVKVEL